MTSSQSSRNPVKRNTSAPGPGGNKVPRQRDEAICSFLDHLPDIVLVHRNGIILYANPAMVETLGLRPDSLPGKPLWDFIPPEYHARVAASIRKRIETGKDEPYDIEIIPREGERRAVLVRGSVIEFDGADALLSVLMDITDRKKVEAELEKNRYFLSEAMDMAQIADWEFDALTGIFTFNDRFYSLYATTAAREGGYHMPAEVYAREFTHPDDKAIVDEEIRNALTSHHPGNFSIREHRIIRRDGEVRWIVVRIRIDKDAQGRIIKTHGANQDITDRKRAEVALRESETKFASVFNNSPAELVLLSLKDGTFIDANESFIINTGYSRDEILGRTPESLGMFADRAVYDEIAATLRDQQYVSGMEVRFRTKNSDMKTGLYSARIFTIGGDAFVLSSIKDITGRKKMEEAIREARQLFSDIISFLPDPTFVIDREGKILAWNHALEKLSGIASGDIIGKGDNEYSVWMYGKRRPAFIDLVLNPDKDIARLNYTDIRWEGRTVTAQTIITRPGSGQVIPLSLVASPLLDAEGRITGAIESMRDISRLKETEAELARLNANLEKIIAERTQALYDEIAQRKSAEQEVQAALEYNRSVIETNPDLMVVLDGKGTLLDVNAAAESMTGVSREQMIGTPYSRYLVDDSTPADILQQLTKKGRAEYTVQLGRTDGHITPLAINTTLFRGKDATDTRIIVAGHDITRQKTDKAAIQAALDEQVLLLREVHHRVNNNLQIIISLTNLQIRQTDDPNVKQSLYETQNRVKAMSLVHEKLYRSASLSHIEFADYTRFLSTQLFAYYAMDTRRVRLDVTLGNIMVDIVTAVPLGLLMNELVSNCLRHAFPHERKGVIRISGGCEGDLITLIVGDDGIGIPADLDWKNTRSLGMRLINSLVDQIDGTITLDRENGTSFTITVKRDPDPGDQNG